MAVTDEVVPTMRFKRQESKLWNNDATLTLGGGGSQDGHGNTMMKDLDVEGPLERVQSEYHEW